MWAVKALTRPRSRTLGSKTAMFESKDRPALTAIVERLGCLLAALRDDLGHRPLVLPTAEFFPDRFTGDEASAERLVARMLELGLAERA